MKFLCSNCKAKYQIPDEKIAGRTLKMDCRRCSTPIVIRGDLGVPDDAEEIVDDGAGRAAAPRAGAPASATSSMAGARRPAAAGRPLGAATGGSSAGPQPTAGRASGRSLGADFRRNVSTAAEPPRAVTPLDQWHVAINDVPVGPMKRDEISRKIAAGAVTGESLAWREGFDDWRPLREIPELAALMRRAQQDSERPPARGAPRAPAPRAPAPRPGAATARPAQAPASARPAARSNVVAIGGRLGASAAPAIDADELDDGELMNDSEPTTVASAADLGLGDFGAFAKDSSKAKAEAAAPAKKPTTGGFKPIPAPGSGGGLGVPAKPAPMAAPVAAKAAALAPMAAPASEGRGSFAPPPPSPAPQPVAAAFVAPAPAPVAPRPMVTEQPRRAAMPIGAMMGIGFAMAAGAVLMYAVVQRFVLAPTTPTPVVATTTVAPIVATPETPHTAPVAVDVPAPTTPEVAVDPTPTTPVAPTAPTHHEHGTTRPPTTTATAPTTTTPHTTTTGSSRFDQFADEGSDGPAPIATAPTARHDEEDGPSASRTELTEAQISEVRRREQRSLQTCWETAIRGMRDVGDVRMDIDITIGASGAVTLARARGPGVGTLSDCIEQRVRRWHFPASSSPTQLTFPVVFSGQ